VKALIEKPLIKVPTKTSTASIDGESAILSKISSVINETLEFVSPISGISRQPLVSLTDAIKLLEGIISDIQAYVWTVLKSAKQGLQKLPTPKSGVYNSYYLIFCSPLFVNKNLFN